MIHLLAPAKINLSLEIIGPLGTTYHEICTVMQSVDLFDELFFSHSTDLTLDVDDPIGLGEGNLILRAARLLQKKRNVHFGASIRLIKNIPISAGLGGGSSDAAATLLGLNQLWKLNLNAVELSQIASDLGSDVPFFITGGTCHGKGRGNELSSLLAPIEEYAVIFSPSKSIIEEKTKRMYGMITGNHFSNGSKTRELIEAITTAKPVAQLLFNVFDSVATLAYSSYSGTKSALDSISPAPFTLAGSGPSLFALFQSEKDMMRVINECEIAEYRAYPVKLISGWSIAGLRNI